MSEMFVQLPSHHSGTKFNPYTWESRYDRFSIVSALFRWWSQLCVLLWFSKKRRNYSPYLLWCSTATCSGSWVCPKLLDWLSTWWTYSASFRFSSLRSVKLILSDLVLRHLWAGGATWDRTSWNPFFCEVHVCSLLSCRMVVATSLDRLGWVFHENNRVNVRWEVAHRPLFGCCTFCNWFSIPFWHCVRLFARMKIKLRNGR